MGCCALEGGDAVSAIPIRNLMNCAAQPFRWCQQEELKMNPKTSKSRHGRKMPLVHPNAAAIDVGATMHMAAVRADRAPEPVRSFGTFTADLHRLIDWFTQCGVETVVMESTSVYWIPVFELLDARGFTVCLVNARDAKHVPGRKTDVSDAQWLQRLHSFGLLRASFRPKGQIVALRSYVRQRERLLEYAASHIQHMQKAFTEMNLQLHHVVADITGATGLRIIRAILAGERDPEIRIERLLLRNVESLSTPPGNLCSPKLKTSAGWVFPCDE
jgi:transposase